MTEDARGLIGPNEWTTSSGRTSMRRSPRVGTQGASPLRPLDIQEGKMPGAISRRYAVTPAECFRADYGSWGGGGSRRRLRGRENRRLGDGGRREVSALLRQPGGFEGLARSSKASILAILPSRMVFPTHQRPSTATRLPGGWPVGGSRRRLFIRRRVQPRGAPRRWPPALDP